MFPLLKPQNNYNISRSLFLPLLLNMIRRRFRNAARIARAYYAEVYHCVLICLSLSLFSSPTRFNDSSSPHTWTFRRISTRHLQLRVIHVAGQSEASVDRRFIRPVCDPRAFMFNAVVSYSRSRVRWYFQPRVLAVFSRAYSQWRTRVSRIRLPTVRRE